MTRTDLIGKTIIHNGHAWEITGVGARTDKAIYLHLASKTRKTQQSNGWCPIQIGDYVPVEALSTLTR